MQVRRACSFLLVAAASTCLASTVGSSLTRPTTSTLAVRENQIWAAPLRDSKFAAMMRASANNNCEASQPPEPLATPNPLLDIADPSSKVSVSFIIGTDGRVHSALILESAGPAEDRTILDTVRSWRYRPALCNGAATETEGKIEFSGQ
ncbi:MAG: energy transducer TonB [Terriglobales bacterium]|jgi:TonB family protein